MPALASKTCWPAKSVTTGVNRACSSTVSTVGMPAALQAGVGLAEGGRHVHHPGAVLGGHVVGREHLERVLPACRPGSRTAARTAARPARSPVTVPACVRPPAPSRTRRRGPRPGYPARRLSPARRTRCPGRPRARGWTAASTAWWSRPRPLARVVQLEPHGHRRVLPLAVDVVHPGLGVGQRGLAPPAVGQHPEALVDQALVPSVLNAHMTVSM